MSKIVNIRRFNDLMLFRIREVLLVSSNFDYFVLQEDSTLTEQVFLEYEEFSLSAAPRFTNAANLDEAWARIEERRFDLILIMGGLELDVSNFLRRVKKKRPDLQIVLLNLDQRDPSERTWLGGRQLFDDVFVWTGDPKILLAIIKSVEDRMNVDHDVDQGNVRVIITVEDSVLYYSLFLRVLYSGLMSLARSLYSEGPSRLYRLMYMRSRPKLLLAKSYEEAADLLEKYERNLFALITDVQVPRRGSLDPRAGLDLVEETRRRHPYLPILIQSAESVKEEAEELRASFVNKNSPALLDDLRQFLNESLGFGDFIFRTPDGKEVARAHDLGEMERILQKVPEESLRYHASQNHISLWLMARSEFELANTLRSQQAEDFESIEELRDYVVRALRNARRSVYGGTISDFRPEQFNRNLFSRIGGGAMGGKARGIAFLNKLLVEVGDEFQMAVQSPQTVVITTDEFERLVEQNDLYRILDEDLPDLEVAREFLDCKLSDELQSDLKSIATQVDAPLAVRSSSLLEDSMHQPLAGIYSTHMIQNNEEDLELRQERLENALKLVYASTYFSNARSFLRTTGKRPREERMAVIIQELVGRRYGDRFYPPISGVAQSHNFYPIGSQKASDGIALAALGLGRFVVEGGMSLRFSPSRPQVMPQFANLETFLDSSQRGFWALPLTKEKKSPLKDSLQFYDLKTAEEDGSLALVGSVYSKQDDQIRDDLSLSGPRLVTFNNILKHHAIPLAETIKQVLDMTKSGFGGSVEIEFACDPGDWGRRTPRGEERKEPTFHLLQARPLAGLAAWEAVTRPCFDHDDLLCKTSNSLGQGILRDLRDLVFVNPDTWDPADNASIAKEVSQLNETLKKENTPYILMGPGRWGSADSWLGVPVQWPQISSARVIIEVVPEKKPITPSQGTHFFHNITSLGIGYLTISPDADDQRAYLDWEWLKAQPVHQETRFLRHLRLEEPVTICLDGRSGRGYISKPGARPVSHV